MSLGNTDIQGSASVSRHVNVGGNADVRGHLFVGHNLRVAGWVDAPHIKGALKGLYASEEALVRAYPRPMPGWYALVGDSLPADVWRAEDGKWVPTGEQGGEPELWLDDLQQRMDEAEEAIEAESEARKTADADLAESIAAEAAAREKADAAILGSVDIGDLDSVTVSQGMASVLGKGPHRFNVMYDGKVVGTLDVIGDDMLHVYTQVLTTHRSIDKEGNLITAHRDDVVNIYYRSMGLRDSMIESGTWTRWKKLQTELVQECGDSDEVAMSQKAVTDELAAITTSINAEVTARQQAIKAITDSIGKPDGIAPLDSAGQIPSKHIPYTTDNVAEYTTTVAEVTLQQQSSAHKSTDAGCSVVFDTAKRKFLLSVFSGGVSYYINWVDADRYGTASPTGRTPTAGRIYICTGDGKTYRWDGSDLVPMGSHLELGHTENSAFPGNEGKDLADEVAQLKANMVMAVEVDEETGAVSLIYDEDNKTISDAYIDESGQITIITEI